MIIDPKRPSTSSTSVSHLGGGRCAALTADRRARAVAAFLRNASAPAWLGASGRRMGNDVGVKKRRKRHSLWTSEAKTQRRKPPKKRGPKKTGEQAPAQQRKKEERAERKLRSGDAAGTPVTHGPWPPHSSGNSDERLRATAPIAPVLRSAWPLGPARPSSGPRCQFDLVWRQPIWPRRCWEVLHERGGRHRKTSAPG